MPGSIAPSAPVGIRISGVTRVFGGTVRALDGIDLAVPAGQFLAILGPSGCGKSTLLRLIAGLDWPDSGTIELDDEAVSGASGDAAPGEEAKISYVFQDAQLLPWRTVLGNVELPLELAGRGRASRRPLARGALDRVGLGDAVDRYPAQLSGGMKMRVSLARALVTRPRLLLLDEPFAALDEITRQKLDDQLRELWRSMGLTVVFVTHSTIEAAFLAQRAIVFSPRPGRIILDTPVALPIERGNAIRSTAEFAAAGRQLYAALEQGESVAEARP
jgi:NitT/TauT family transport system ATP-binding protein